MCPKLTREKFQTRRVRRLPTMATKNNNNNPSDSVVIFDQLDLATASKGFSSYQAMPLP